MNDLKDIQSESSYHVDKDSDGYKGLPTLDTDENRLEKTAAGNLWEGLEAGIEKDLDSSEFSGGVEASPEKSDVAYEASFSSESDAEINEGDFELPDGFADLPPSERFIMGMPSADQEHYQGPSADVGYQSADDLESPPTPAVDEESTRPVFSAQASGEDKTVSIQQDLNSPSSPSSPVGSSDADRTVAVEGFASARVGGRKAADVDVKVSVGGFRGSRGSANVMTSVDASLAQAESLKLAQQRILELEREVEQLRSENEELASAGEVIRSRVDDLTVRVSEVEKEKAEVQESAQSEILVLKGNLQHKENEATKARSKIEELEARLKSDFKKIRVRERELENRLELLRAEKSALVRSKDEYILEQKRKIDQLSQELDNYRKKCLELNKTIEANQDQVKRTERALRLALTNLEAKDENLVPLKKAE